MAGILLPSCAIFFSGLLLIIFYSKRRINLLENKIYSYMLAFIFFDSILATTLQGFVPGGFNELERYLIPWLNRLDVILLIAYTGGLLFYTLTISNPKFEKDFKRRSMPFIILYLIAAVLILLLDVNIIQSGNNFSVDGKAITIAYLACGFNIFASIFFGVLNIKKRDKRYTPIYSIFFIAIFLLIIFKMNPYLIVISITFTFVNYIMYHTIENPDLVVIEELAKAKDQAEKYSNDKAVFLFNISQQIREPLKSIETLAEEVSNEHDINEIKEQVGNIKVASQRLQYIINGSLDLSEIDAKDIKITDSVYNIKSVIEQIKLKYTEELKDSDVKFNVVVSEDLPEKLYGDSIRIKQILNTLLSNAVTYTKEGGIDLNINSILKRDVCRIIIKVEDTGCGIKKEVLNTLFEKKEEETNISVDKPNVSLIDLKKMINLIGGTIMVQSEEDKGTEFTVMLDQRVVKDEENKEIATTISKYNNTIFDKSKILFVYESGSLDNVMKMIDTTTYEITKYSNAEDALNHLRRDLDFDLIVLDDNIEKLDSETILKKMKIIDGFNIPVLLTTDNEKMSKNYIEMGFDEVLLKPIRFKEFDLCIGKYLNSKKNNN